MKIGMLWYITDKKQSLLDAVKQAVEYYQKKYEKKPTLCVTNPATHKDKHIKGTEYPVEVTTDRSILPNHLWIGIS